MDNSTMTTKLLVQTMTWDHLSNVVHDRGPNFLCVFSVLLGVFFFSKLFRGNALNLPLVGKDRGNAEQRRKSYLKNAAELYEEGHQMFKDKPYRITAVDGERVVVPLSALEELRRLPDDQINAKRELEKMVEGKYTGMGGSSNFLNHMVRSDLTHSLNRINPRLAAEVDRTVDAKLGLCQDWTEVIMYEKLLIIVAIVSGHIFLGPELCRREDWIHTSIHFTVDLFAAVRKLKQWNDWLRPIVSCFTPELRTIWGHKKKARAFLVPVIQQRRRMIKNGGEVPDDMLQWMINKAGEFNMTDDDVAVTQLTLSMAAIHTTTITTADVLLELALLPDVVEELRDEIKRVVAANDGVLGTSALFQMKLLDSFMRETQRVHPLAQVRFGRHVDKPVTLSDGTHLPAGSVIEAAHGRIVNDPELYPNPETFDPYRFVKLRTTDTPDPIGYTNREQYQFVTVAKENMGFGYGRHACPGRFFAANEIKLIVARILLQYDVRMPGGSMTKYKEIVQGASVSPNPKNKIEIRKVAIDKS